jgi:hypothetical protein
MNVITEQEAAKIRSEYKALMQRTKPELLQEYKRVHRVSGANGSTSKRDMASDLIVARYGAKKVEQAFATRK